MKWILVAATALCACGDGQAMTPDSGVEPGDFFGETCRSDPFPSNTTCRDGAGWCVDDVCRPHCVQDAHRCPGAAERHSPAGACFCVPL